jgi:hypothetical protein
VRQLRLNGHTDKVVADLKLARRRLKSCLACRERVDLKKKTKKKKKKMRKEKKKKKKKKKSVVVTRWPNGIVSASPAEAAAINNAHNDTNAIIVVNSPKV